MLPLNDHIPRRTVPVVTMLIILVNIVVDAAGIGASGAIAYFAHIGGFVSGMILIVLMDGTRKPRYEMP
jgi:membrane associated rhomboid family serine protease